MWESLKYDYRGGVHQSQIISAQIIKVWIFTAFFFFFFFLHYNIWIIEDQPRSGPPFKTSKSHAEERSLQHPVCISSGQRWNSHWGEKRYKAQARTSNNLTKAPETRCDIVTHYLCFRPNWVATANTGMTQTRCAKPRSRHATHTKLMCSGRSRWWQKANRASDLRYPEFPKCHSSPYASTVHFFHLQLTSMSITLTLLTPTNTGGVKEQPGPSSKKTC